MHMRVKILQIIRPDTISRYNSHSTQILIDKINIGSFTMIHFNIVIRNGKIPRKRGPYFWCFFLDLKYLGWSYRENIKTAKYDGFCEGLLIENDFETISATSYCYKDVANASEAVLAIFYIYDYGANASEAVQKIASNQKHYHKDSLCVTDCWIAKMFQWITMKKGWLLGHLWRSYKSCRSYTEKDGSPWWVLPTMEVR